MRREPDLDPDDPRLDRLLRGSNAVMFVGTHRTWLVSTLGTLASRWASSAPPPTQPTMTLDDLVALDGQRPAAVDTLLQSIALVVSPTMLVMQLYVLRGGRVVDVQCAWRWRAPLVMRIVVAGIDGVERTFESNDANDFVVLKQLQVWRDRDLDDDDWVADAAIVAGFEAIELGLTRSA